MGTFAAGAVVAKNYLPFARVLASSFSEHHPEVPFFVLLMDEPDGLFRPEDEPFEVILQRDLPVPERSRFCFQYQRQQAVCAMKPHLLDLLIKRGFDHALFLDADVLVLGELGGLFTTTAASNLVLTPHTVTAFTGPDASERELNLLQSGAFNGGVMGVSNTPEGRRFLSWWQQRLFAHCRHAISEGMQYDQRWLDLAPAMFSGVEVLRDPCYNVAHWNLPDRALRLEGDRVHVGEEPCRLFHFSGFDPSQPERVTRYGDRVSMGTSGARELFARYARSLNAAGFGQTRDWPYTYGMFDNGVRIPDVARAAYLELGDGVARFGDPFRTRPPDAFFSWLKRPVDGFVRSGHVVTNLWDAAYRRRPDVRHAYPDHLGADRQGFLEWTRNTGAGEHDVPAELGA